MLDASFGNGGVTIAGSAWGVSHQSGLGSAFQSDGKAIVTQSYHGGGGNIDMRIVRLNTNGSVDTSFGVNGYRSVALNGNDVANAVTIQADGKILLAGSTTFGNTGDHGGGGSARDMAVVRLTADGALDTSFGNSGSLIYDFDGGADYAGVAAIDAAGKLVIAGAAHNGDGTDGFGIVRYNLDQTIQVLPTRPTEVLAAVVSPTRIDVSWTDNINGETGFTIERRIGGDGPWIRIATAAADAEFYSDTSVHPHTEYSYRISPLTGSGTGSPPSPSDPAPPVRTSPPDPAAPTGFTATEISPGRFTLAWNDAQGETGYYVQQQYGRFDNFTTIATLNANATSYQTLYLPNRGYKFRIAAVRNGHIDFTEVKELEPADTSTVNQGPYRNLQASVNEDDVELSWTRVPASGGRVEGSVWARTFDNPYPESWHWMFQDGGSIIESVNAPKTSTTLSSFAFENADLRIENSLMSPSGFIPDQYTNIASGTFSKPTAAPTNLAAWTSQDGRIHVSWQHANAAEVGFWMVRPTATFIFIVPRGYVEHSRTHISMDAPFGGGGLGWVAVQAGGSGGWSNHSQAVYASKPESPDALTFEVESSSRVNLAWKDRSAHEDGFTILRSLNGGAFEQIGTVGADQSAYTDTAADLGGDAVYKVIAYNHMGDSGETAVTVLATRPTVSVALVADSAKEAGPVSQDFTFTRTGDLSDELTVDYVLSGTADLANDYTISGDDVTSGPNATHRKVTFAANSSTATVTITPVADEMEEETETVVATVTASEAETEYAIGSPAEATIEIEDMPVVSVSAESEPAKEAGPVSRDFTFTRTGDLSDELTVNYVLSGTADIADDYAISGDDVTSDPSATHRRVKFAANSSTATITVTPVDDSEPEEEETVILTLLEAEDDEYERATSAADISIADNDIDLDVDSNNDGTIDPDNEYGSSDDSIEDDSDKPGKMVDVNDDDTDDDGVPDYADGYNLPSGLAGSDDDLVAGEQFTAVNLALGAGIDLSTAVFSIVYDQSDPFGITVTSDPESGEFIYQRPTLGAFRLWTQAGDVARSGENLNAGGDFIVSGESYAWNLLASAERTFTLWLEAIQPLDQPADEPSSSPLLLQVEGTQSSTGAVLNLQDRARLTVNQNAVLVAFDGTFNYPGQEFNNIPYVTNIQRFANTDIDRQSEFVIYEDGIGNLADNPGVAGINELFKGDPLQGATGLGGKAIENEAFDKLSNAYLAGRRTIDIIGFSRGAAISLDFANMLTRRGIDMGRYRQVPLVRFMGLFDMVAQFFPANVGYDLEMPANTIVRHTYHAMAYDEGRALFPMTRVPIAKQMWFRGVHGTIGASDKTYQWMIDSARRWRVPITAPAGLVLTGATTFTANGTSYRKIKTGPLGDLYYPGDTFDGQRDEL